MHLLLWIKAPQQILLHNICTDIPWHNCEGAFQVYHLQKSHKDSLAIHDGDTCLEQSGNSKIIEICHFTDVFALNLKAYICIVIQAFECRMDVQMSDGHGLLLQYFSLYV